MPRSDHRDDGFAHNGKLLLAAGIKSWSKDRNLSVLEEEKRMDEEDGLQPGPSSVIFRSWRCHRRSTGRVNRKEHTVRFKVFLLLVISTAWAVSIEYPSLGWTPPYAGGPHLHLTETKVMLLSQPIPLPPALGISPLPNDMGEVNSFNDNGRGAAAARALLDVPPSDGIGFPSFALSHPNTNPAGLPPQDLTSHSTSSSTLSEFYLEKPHE